MSAGSDEANPSFQRLVRPTPRTRSTGSRFSPSQLAVPLASLREISKDSPYKGIRPPSSCQCFPFLICQRNIYQFTRYGSLLELSCTTKAPSKHHYDFRSLSIAFRLFSPHISQQWPQLSQHGTARTMSASTKSSGTSSLVRRPSPR